LQRAARLDPRERRGHEHIVVIDMTLEDLLHSLGLGLGDAALQ
jgi:hypothetical protein